MQPAKLTELEKTILVSFYALSGGSTRKYVDKDTVVKKFPMRQRKAVRNYIEEIAKKKLIIKHKTEEKYRINEKAKKKIANVFMIGGVRLRL